MQPTLKGFTSGDTGYERSETAGSWLVEKKEYLQEDDGAPKQFFWEVTARTTAGSISAQFPSDPLDQDTIRAHIESAPSLEAGPLACSSWFETLEAMTNGEAFVMDRWLKKPLRKSDGSPEQLERRARFIEALRATGWTVGEKMLANFEGDIAQSPDLIASLDEHQVSYFVMSNLVEAWVGGLLVRMFAPSDFQESLRSLDPLIKRSAKGAVEWAKRASPLHQTCLLRDPSRGWVTLAPPS